MLDYRIQRLGASNDVVVCELSGQLDAAGCDLLNSVIEGELAGDSEKLIIDCQDLQYISSQGLGLLVQIHSRMKKKGGHAKLSRVHGMIGDIIRMVMLDKVLQIYPTVQDAVEAF